MKPAILLIQLGTPESPTAGAIYRYLAQFLSDPRVVSLPSVFWRPLLFGFIAPLRAWRVAERYRRIWLKEGPPLRIYLERLAEKLRRGGFQVAIGMRYGHPSIIEGLQLLEGAEEIVVLPLYPQFSQTTTLSVFDELSRVLQKRSFFPNLRLITHYHDFPPYIEAVADQVRAFWQKAGEPQKLLFSFHGLPEKSRQKGDPYFEQCHTTACLIAQRLGLKKEKWQVVFQSRFGFGRWLEPACGEVLERLPKEGIRSVDVVSPGFSIDCLETLEEIAQSYREVFLKAGGKRFHHLPALNDDDRHVAMIEKLVFGN